MWLRQGHQRFFASRRAARRASPARHSVRLRLEHLEDRMAPAALTGAAGNNNSDVFQGILDQENAVINGVLAGTSQAQLSSALVLFGASNSTGSLRSMPPPALVSLYIDGVSLETTRQGLEHVNYGNEIVLNGLGQGPPPSTEAVQFDNALQPWLQFVYQARGSQNSSLIAVVDDIHANLPETGLLGRLAFVSGVQGVDWAVQL